MSARLLQSQIHASYATGSGVWADFRTGVTGLFLSESGNNSADFRDHLIREFNRKINDLNQPTGLFIAPYDAGFRFIGTGISSPISINTYLRSDGISSIFRPDGVSLYEQPSV